MIAPLAKLMDWSAVQAMTLMLPANFYRNNPRLEEALEFLNGPEFIPVRFPRNSGRGNLTGR